MRFDLEDKTLSEEAPSPYNLKGKTKSGLFSCDRTPEAVKDNFVVKDNFLVNDKFVVNFTYLLKIVVCGTCLARIGSPGRSGAGDTNLYVLQKPSILSKPQSKANFSGLIKSSIGALLGDPSIAPLGPLSLLMNSHRKPPQSHAART